MMKDMITFISIAAAAALGPLALRFGAESRPGFDERPDSRRNRRSI
jgi:hypothetical protein